MAHGNRSFRRRSVSPMRARMATALDGFNARLTDSERALTAANSGGLEVAAAEVAPAAEVAAAEPAAAEVPAAAAAAEVAARVARQPP